MRIIADLHIHGKYSRATSKQSDIPNLEKYARLKGISLLGTGDFTHPKWSQELKQYLTEDGTGFLRTKTGFPFVMQTEVSLIYSQDNIGRRIHNIILAPSFEVAAQVTSYLTTKGRVDYDGRPIFNIPCPEFVDSMISISKEIEVIPAHVWTPWFSLFGSKSGFNSMKECYQDQTKNIHAIETGLSSDPAMNWLLSQLDNYQILSFSDSHSFWPWRLGREATIFDIEPTYKELLAAIRTGENLMGTIEVDPSYGKYHFDGHRLCGVSLAPKESIRNRNICPSCRRELTIGVLHRVEELADRENGFRSKNAKPYYKLVPLSELIASELKSTVSSKQVWKEYFSLIKGATEFDVMMDMSKEELEKRTSPEIAELILKNRDAQLLIKPGYDGVYGEIVLEETRNTHVEIPQHRSFPRNVQTGLKDFI